MKRFIILTGLLLISAISIFAGQGNPTANLYYWDGDSWEKWSNTVSLSTTTVITATLTDAQVSLLRNVWIGSGTVTVSNYNSNTSTVTNYAIDVYTGKTSTGSAGLVSGGGQTTVTITDTVTDISFYFLGSTGTCRSNRWDGILNLRNGADYSRKINPPGSITLIFDTNDTATIDYWSEEIQ